MAAKKEAETEGEDKQEQKPAQPEQNGVTRPKDGTKTGRVWEIADKLSEKAGEPAQRKDVINKCLEEDINASTAATQYGRWRKFHGLAGQGKGEE